MWGEQVSWGGYCLICFPHWVAQTLCSWAQCRSFLLDCVCGGYWSSTNVKKNWEQVGARYVLVPGALRSIRGNTHPGVKIEMVVLRLIRMGDHPPKGMLGTFLPCEKCSGWVEDGDYVPILGTVKHPGGSRWGRICVEPEFCGNKSLRRQIQCSWPSGRPEQSSEERNDRAVQVRKIKVGKP